ncbi:hypothetical protein BVRB_1g017780 [Beta vulgaris subsp. vulgaris]|uniref:uncharacterized protein LOC104905277 n=1 Tax=Beta vulgaris subsp. vulgaris TaxID=3555 RepID=UPI00053F4A0A|nr:uncharacterized protein LOC104905277 [Beta vulgaris subsp. vulgaris]KMS99933.1 hypothetical protein BVRB_1g017780 [Beta vulgaris subsp. vulgaris]
MEVNKGIKSRGRPRFTSEETGDSSFECSGKHCRSCAAAIVADCVAVCCCPLAVVSLLALAFVKVPYLVGKKCLRKRNNRKRKCKIIGEVGNIEINNRDINLISGRLSQSKSDIIIEFGKDAGECDQDLEERTSFCAAFEADKVLLELYQVGHLGFGRVSFTGIQPFSKEN